MLALCHAEELPVSAIFFIETMKSARFDFRLS